MELKMRKGLMSMEKRIINGYSTGEGESYIPLFKAREVSSDGFCSSVINPFTGRSMELMSEGEEWLVYNLLFDPSVKDIREQFWLSDLTLLKDITDSLGMRPYSMDTPLTADLFVDHYDGTQVAYQVKCDRESIANSIDAQMRMIVEGMYWTKKKVIYQVVYKEDMDPIRADNIEEIFEYYNASAIHDEIGLIKHLMAHKVIEADISHGRIDFKYEAEKNRKVMMDYARKKQLNETIFSKIGE